MKLQKNVIEYRLLLQIAYIVQSLNPAATVRLGRLLGCFAYYFVPIRKSVVFDNLTKAFPEKSKAEKRRIARQSYMNIGQNLFEFMRTPIRSKTELNKRVIMYNSNLLHEAYQSGRGTLLLTGHFGNWEIMACAIRALGYPIVAIAKHQRNHLVDAMITKYRLSVGLEAVALGMNVREFLRSLKQNKFVAILPDQDAHREGIFVNFFNQPSATAPGPAALALKTRAHVIFGVCILVPKGNYHVYLEKIDYDDLSDSNEENIRIFTQRHVKVLEDKIRRWPDHWFWMHKRWKTKPSDV